MTAAAVVCARFQPPCRAHVEALTWAAQRHARVLVALLGADEACSLANPWSVDARRALLASARLAGPGVEYLALRDRRYERTRWSAELAELVGSRLPPAMPVVVIADAEHRAGLPPWPVPWAPGDLPTQFEVAEQSVRDALFWRTDAPDWALAGPLVAAGTEAALRTSLATPALAALRDEARYLRDYRAAWAAAPYPPVFVTVDALVSWRDAVLLIERGRLPGRGLLALPGGFIDPSEALAAACVRELREETGLDLTGMATPAARVFDDPERSLRGRTITHVYHYDLDPSRPQPRVAGADDARAARWWPRAALGPGNLFDDHYAILQTMLGLA